MQQDVPDPLRKTQTRTRNLAIAGAVSWATVGLARQGKSLLQVLLAAAVVLATAGLAAAAGA